MQLIMPPDPYVNSTIRNLEQFKLQWPPFANPYSVQSGCYSQVPPGFCDSAITIFNTKSNRLRIIFRKQACIFVFFPQFFHKNY